MIKSETLNVVIYLVVCYALAAWIIYPWLPALDRLTHFSEVMETNRILLSALLGQ